MISMSIWKENKQSIEQLNRFTFIFIHLNLKKKKIETGKRQFG